MKRTTVKICFCMLWVALVGCFLSCGKEEDPMLMGKKKTIVAATDTLRVLSIGNSFSVDALGYVPFLMAELAPDVDFTLCIAHDPYCSLKKHFENANNGYGYTLYFNVEAQPWSSRNDMSLASILDLAPWDIIIFQQVSYDSYKYSSCQPHLDQLIEWVKNRASTPSAMAWLITLSFADGSEQLSKYGFNSDGMAQSIGQCAKSIIQETPISLIIPSGTAVQYARHTSLDQYGQFGHLTYDGSHLQPGIACLTEAYAATEALLRFKGRTMLIANSRMNIDDNWVVINNIPQSGSLLGVTEANLALAKQCALQAIDNPYWTSKK